MTLNHLEACKRSKTNQKDLANEAYDILNLFPTSKKALEIIVEIEI